VALLSVPHGYSADTSNYFQVSLLVDPSATISEIVSSRIVAQQLKGRTWSLVEARPLLNGKVDTRLDIGEPSLWEAPAYGRRHHTTSSERSELTKGGLVLPLEGDRADRLYLRAVVFRVWNKKEELRSCGLNPSRVAGYLITRSALANTFGGIVRPICFAERTVIRSQRQLSDVMRARHEFLTYSRRTHLLSTEISFASDW